MDIFEHLVINIDQTKHDSIIAGDLNTDFLKIDAPGSQAKRLNNISQAYNYKQVINRPTRITEHSKTIIDLTFTNIDHQISHGVALVSVADHLMNFLVIVNHYPPFVL